MGKNECLTEPERTKPDGTSQPVLLDTSIKTKSSSTTQIWASKFSLTPERQQDDLINHSVKTAAFRGPQLEQKSHCGKCFEVGI